MWKNTSFCDAFVHQSVNVSVGVFYASAPIDVRPPEKRKYGIVGPCVVNVVQTMCWHGYEDMDYYRVTVAKFGKTHYITHARKCY